MLLVLAQFTSYGQEARDITGTVKDQSGEGLPGATVKVSGSGNGVVTDANGAFRISASAGSVLTASYIGFKSTELKVGGSNVYNFVLTSENTLDNVVVTGYGTQKKRDLSGSQTTIGEDAIKSIPMTSPDQAIQGRAAGVQVQMSSGAPGGAVQVRIRGTNSMANQGANQPLYVVDGIPLFYNERDNALGTDSDRGATQSNSASPLSTISPNDIESIEVLKDASSTAIYGARAANGVVLITTKKGKSGAPVISLNANYAAQSLRRKVPVINAQERAGLVFEHRRNRGTNGADVFDPFALNPFAYGKGTDWQDEIFRTAPMQNLNLSIGGGSDKITYNVSGDYLDHQGILVNTYFKRAGTRANVDITASDRLRIGTSTAINTTWTNEQRLDETNTPSASLAGILSSSPMQPVYLNDGSFTGQPNLQTNGGLLGGNALADFLLADRSANRNRALSNIYAEYSFLKDFKFRSAGNLDYQLTNLRQKTPIFYRELTINSLNNVVGVFEATPRTFNWLLEQTLQYAHQFGDHAVTGLAGFSAQNTQVRVLVGGGQGALFNPLDQIDNNTAGNTSGNRSVFGGIRNSGLVSQFVRGTYGYKGKYMATATVRRDGSSRFGGNNKYGYFPSGSVGWRVSEEGFFKNNIKAISEFKLRASYGVTGSQEIQNFLYLPLTQGNSAVFGNSIIDGQAPQRFEDKDIKWERTAQLDLGVDIGLLKGRLNITADYYDKLTEDLIGIAPLSVISGVGNNFQTNIASVANKGYELAVDSRILDKKDLKWNLGFNISTNKNRVKSIGALQQINGAPVDRLSAPINNTVVGREIGTFWLYETGPMYMTFEEAAKHPVTPTRGFFTPGDLSLIDQNNDGVMNDLDRRYVGSPFPDFFGGINTNVSYKSWSLGVFAPFQSGNKIWDQKFLNAATFEGNSTREIYDNRYLPSRPGVATKVPIPRNGGDPLPSTLFLKDGSFFRIRSISLGYDVPRKALGFLSKTGSLRLVAQANNVFVFTKYNSWDPEVNSFGSSVTTNGLDIGAYPQSRSFNFGLNMNF
jgi:TonB-linked SusC/RagA family outer membrane protein